MREPTLTEQPVTIFGGSGFVGRHVVRALARRGYRIRVAVRRPDLANFLQPMGTVGQIRAVQANIRDRGSIERALDGAMAAANLVGILAEQGHQRFDAVHDEGARVVAEAAAARGIERFVHLSAIGAGPDSPSIYARSKAAGEAATREAIPGAVILRPSIQFGPEDSFFNRFASMARFAPALPLIGGGHTKFQPVFVGDVAAVVAKAIDGEVAGGAPYELGGPEVKTFRECMELMLRETGRKRLLLPLPVGIARFMGGVLQYLPGRLLTTDQVIQLGFDNIVSEEAKAAGRTLEGLGIDGTTLASILPTYLVRYRKRGQFDRQLA